MTAKALEQDPLATFFKEESSGTQEIFEKSELGEAADLKDPGKSPSLASGPAAEADELKIWWRNLRAFFRSGKGGGLPYSKNKPGLTPALFSGYDTANVLFTDYPLWIGDAQHISDEDFGKCIPVRSLIEQGIGNFEDENHQKNLSRYAKQIIRAIGDKLNEAGAPIMCGPLLSRILDELEESLSLNDADAKSFNTAITLLKASLPNTGVFLPFSREIPYQILASVLDFESKEKTIALLENIDRIKGNLQDILSVELDNRPDSKKVEHLKSSYDFAESLLDFKALSDVLPDADSELMSADRFKRIQKVISTLDGAKKLLSSKASILIDKELYSEKSINWADIFEGCEVRQFSKDKGCNEALAAFEASMTTFSDLIAAVRIASLEIKELYDPDVHADFFASFAWTVMSAEEMESIPKTVLLTTTGNLLNGEFGSFSRLLSSNTPIKVLAINNGEGQTFKNNGSETDTSFRFNQELATFAITHRNTFTLQATSSTPVELFTGMMEGVRSYSPSLFHVLLPNPAEGVTAVWTSAAVESRKFPGFTYNGNVDVKWGSRFSVTNNPQSDEDWPSHEITLADGDAVIANFTFADYASLDKKFQGHFLIVPPEYWSEDLVPVSEYLNLDNVENYGKVPFIWMVDGGNTLQKVATTLPLMLLSKERLDFWQSLQENSGINSFHVEKALESEKESLQKKVDDQVELLKSEHAKAIEEVKELSTAEAMEQLTAVLLDLDTSSIVTAPPVATPAPAKESSDTEGKSAESEVKEEEVPAEEEEETLSLEEPWIETPLCTTCDECTDLNKKLFNYNSDKMAFVADPKSGTFADLVEAAELCPVSIIHPGTPLNPDEANLDDLVKRAEKYN